jgi:hypothetical protein
MRGEIDQRDRVVIVIGNQQPLAVGADRDPGRLRLDVDAVAGRVAELDRATGGREAGLAATEQMDDVVDPAADGEASPVGHPGDARIGIGHDQGLLQPRTGAVDPIGEDILARLRGDDLAVGPVETVEPAGQHEHLAAVGADRDRRRAVGDIIGMRADPRHQWTEHRAGRRERGERLAGRQLLGGCRGPKSGDKAN